MRKKVQQILEEEIRPLIRKHDGDVELLGLDEETGIVTVRLGGTCVGCPLSQITLKVGIQQTLQRHLPWITSVVAASEAVFDQDSEE